MSPEPVVHLPVCPMCSQPPTLLMGGGIQAFCGNTDCRVITWNPAATYDQFWTDAKRQAPLDLSGLKEPT